MTIDTSHYTEFFQQGQETVRKAVDTWTRTITAAVTQLPSATAQLDAEAAIDRYFELNEKLLVAQRDFAKKLVGYAAAAGAGAQERGATGTEAATEA